MSGEDNEGLMRVLGRLEGKLDGLIESHNEMKGDHKELDKRVTELETHKKVATTVLGLIGAGAGAAASYVVKIVHGS